MPLSCCCHFEYLQLEKHEETFRQWTQMIISNKNKLKCQFYSPTTPDGMDWSTLYPAFFANQDVSCQKAQVEFADIGCGYGGLLGNNC